jgi:hypothetical protein
VRCCLAPLLPAACCPPRPRAPCPACRTAAACSAQAGG